MPLVKNSVLVGRVFSLDLGSWGSEEDILAAGLVGGAVGIFAGYRHAGFAGAAAGFLAGALLAGAVTLPVSLALRRSPTHTPSGAPLT